MKPVINFFKSIGEFLNRAEDYMDYRVRTGKYVGDIQVATKDLRAESIKHSKGQLSKFQRSILYKLLFGTLLSVWKQLLKIPFFGLTISIAIYAIKLLTTFFLEALLTVTLSFLSTIFLLNLFYSSIVQFFIFLIPILLLNLLLVAAFYKRVYLHEKGEKISFLKTLPLTKPKFFEISKLFLFQTMLFILAIISFSILALFFKFFFDAIATAWSGSFIYWFFVIFTGLCFLFGALIVSVLTHQSFFIMLLDDQTVDDAIKSSLYFTKAYLSQFFFYYLVLYLSSIILFLWAGLYYLYFGMTIVIFLTIHVSLLLGFLLRKKYYTKFDLSETAFAFNTKQLFILIILFGFVNYGFAAVIISRQFTYLTGIFETQRDSYFLTKALQRYTNTLYKFSIEYPQSWNMYERRSSSVTFYHNYTGTMTGGIWLNITITPYSEKDFLRLYHARPGLISLDTTTKDVTTKVSNINIQNYNGVNYTVYKENEPYPEYQTHYLIHKDNYMYDIMFTALDKDIEGNNLALFERIVASFRFIEE